jgi:hypothetical protein
LDKPTVDISSAFVGTGFDDGNNDNLLQFTYDESNKLTLSAENAHPLDNLQYNGGRTYYTYSWAKGNDNTFSSSRSAINLSDVADSGVYTLTIMVHSPYGETAQEDTLVEVSIARKALNLGSISFADAVYQYSGQLND